MYIDTEKWHKNSPKIRVVRNTSTSNVRKETTILQQQQPKPQPSTSNQDIFNDLI